MYLSFVFQAVFIGYSIGAAPITSYNYGAKTHAELKNILKKSLIISVVFGVVMTALTEALALPLSKIFVGYDAELLSLTATGMRLYGLSFLIFGTNIFASSFFTSLNDGLISALISFARTLLFQSVCILVMPKFFGTNGIWLSIVVAETLALTVSVTCLITKRKKYHY